MDDFTPDSAQQIHDLKLKYGMKIEPTEDDSPETQVDFLIHLCNISGFT